jgi:hypothetical protein
MDRIVRPEDWFYIVIFFWPIFIEYHDHLTSNYTKFQPDFRYIRAKISTYENDLVEKRNRENDMNMSKFYYVYSGSQYTIWCNLKLGYRDNSLKIGHKNISM